MQTEEKQLAGNLNNSAISRSCKHSFNFFAAFCNLNCNYVLYHYTCLQLQASLPFLYASHTEVFASKAPVDTPSDIPLPLLSHSIVGGQFIAQIKGLARVRGYRYRRKVCVVYIHIGDYITPVCMREPCCMTWYLSGLVHYGAESGVNFTSARDRIHSF